MFQIKLEADGWHIVCAHNLSDEEAREFTFLWDHPADVVAGTYVQMDDPDGTRIGYVKRIEYRERLFGPGQVAVSIELR